MGIKTCKASSKALQEKLDNWDNIKEEDIILTIKYRYIYFILTFLFLFFWFAVYYIIAFYYTTSNRVEKLMAITIFTIVLLFTFLFYWIRYRLLPKFYFYKNKVVMKKPLFRPVVLNYQDIGLYARYQSLFTPFNQYDYILRVLERKRYLYSNQKQKIVINTSKLFKKQINDFLLLVGKISGVYYDIDSFKDKMAIEPLINENDNLNGGRL